MGALKQIVYFLFLLILVLPVQDMPYLYKKCRSKPRKSEKKKKKKKIRHIPKNTCISYDHDKNTWKVSKRSVHNCSRSCVHKVPTVRGGNYWTTVSPILCPLTFLWKRVDYAAIVHVKEQIKSKVTCKLSYGLSQAKKCLQTCKRAKWN